MISEELWGVGEPRGPQYMNVNWIGPAVMQLGSEEQRQEYFAPIAAGEAMWCQGFSEPDAGSDLSALKTAAVRDGEYYIVNGQKIWTSYAHAADYCFLLVRTAKSENPRRGISVLLVPMNLPASRCGRSPPSGSGTWSTRSSSPTSRCRLRYRLGGENEGWNIIRHLLASERVGNARHEWVDRSLDRLVDEALAADGVDTADSRFWETLGRAAAWTAASRVLNYAAVQAWSGWVEGVPEPGRHLPRVDGADGTGRRLRVR